MGGPGSGRRKGVAGKAPGGRLGNKMIQARANNVKQSGVPKGVSRVKAKIASKKYLKKIGK